MTEGKRGGDEDEGSNRTFMELKFESCYNYAVVVKSSNRTFMELKLATLSLEHHPLPCSNRTFMELKSLSHDVNTLSTQVLIAPLWN